ncbi:hypothetical protein COHA_010009 [Chlorella ohadii]|uniref:Follistatin-like domain-containing protein n=1 Tax=Chlorella ohadii TaxID=2649997 RepID=A0AAD5DGN5_9CHLO|nr:hypothetical protein COHA_010009 [Chlorella ohadii]
MRLRTVAAVFVLAACASAALVAATSESSDVEAATVLTCNTVKCKEGHRCKIKHGHPKCLRINPCAHHHCKRGHYCRAVAGKPECVSKCTRKKCSEGKTCKLKRGKARCVRQKDQINPCAATLCAIGNQCVVEGGKAQCISVCASVRCKDGLECQPDEKGNPQCVAPAATNPCAFTTCLVGNFCQVENGQAICVTNCATVKCTDGTRCETDPQSGNAACVPDGFAMRRMT